MPRLYREAPLNSLWEGSGNVMALDVLRVLERDREAFGLVLDDLTEATGADAHLKWALGRLEGYLREPQLLETRARSLVEGLALLAAATILRTHAPQSIADAFIATRLSGSSRQTYGQGLERFDTRQIIDRALPG